MGSKGQSGGEVQERESGEVRIDDERGAQRDGEKATRKDERLCGGVIRG